MDDTVDRRDLTPDEIAAAHRYAIVIEWSPEDDAFVVSVPDIPNLHTHGSTREEAAMMGDEAIAVWLAADQDLGIEAQHLDSAHLAASARAPSESGEFVIVSTCRRRNSQIYST